MSEPSRRRDLACMAGLTLVGLVISLIFRARFQTAGLALGSDPVLWGLSAKNLATGQFSAVPPLYPALMALLDPIKGVSVLDAGMFLSAASFSLLLPSIYLVSRYLGARPWAAFLAGLTVLGVPGLVRLCAQVQPDATTAVVLVLAVPLVGRFLEEPSWRRLAALAIYGSLAALLREHGIVLALSFMGVALLGRASVPVRLARVGLVALAVFLAPAVTGHPPSAPWDAPWMDRIDMAVEGAEKEPISPEPEHRARQLAHEQAHLEHDVVGIVSYHAWNSLFIARTEWTWMGLGLLLVGFAVPRRRWISVALPVLPSASALFVFSQARHVSVAIPIVMAVYACALSGPRWLKAMAAVGSIALVGQGVSNWIALPTHIDNKVASAMQSREAGERLCELARVGDLAGGEFFDARAYCPLPHTWAVDETLAWKTWWLGDSPPGVGWQTVSPPYDYYGKSFYIWRYRPDIPHDERPCRGSRPAPDTPYFNPEKIVARLEPPCTE